MAGEKVYVTLVKSSLRYAQFGVSVQLSEPLRKAQFVRRYKRFFAEVRIDGETLIAHVPNTGSLKTCLFEGADCVISETTNPARKLKATLHFLKTPTSWVGVNTSLPNALVHEAWRTRQIPEWHAFTVAQREYKISPESRLDLVLARHAEHLASKQNLHHIEVKNVSYAEDRTARFPDAVTTRGQKHLQDLIRLREQGHGAEIVFVIQRHDCFRFAPADQIDPVYGQWLRRAHEAGVQIRAHACTIDPERGVTLNSEALILEW